MLAVVALWAAAPAFACLAPAPCHCCRGMMMNCDSAAMISAQPCCQLHNQNSAIPPKGAAAPELQFGPARVLALAALPDSGDPSGQRSGSAKPPPPLSLLGASTILRI